MRVLCAAAVPTSSEGPPFVLLSIACWCPGVQANCPQSKASIVYSRVMRNTTHQACVPHTFKTHAQLKAEAEERSRTAGAHVAVDFVHQNMVILKKDPEPMISRVMELTGAPVHAFVHICIPSQLVYTCTCAALDLSYLECMCVLKCMLYAQRVYVSDQIHFEEGL